MIKLIFDICNFSQTIIYIILLITAFKASKNSKASNWVKYFYWYPLVGLIIGCIATLMYIYPNVKFFAFKLNIVSILFHFVFLAAIFYNQNKNKLMKAVCVLSVFILFYFVYIDIRFKIQRSFGFANIMLFFFSAVYLIDEIKKTTNILLLQTPIFYIVIGLFLGSGIASIGGFAIEYFRSVKAPIDELKIAYIFGGFGYIIFDIFFIKAMFCSMKYEK